MTVVPGGSEQFAKQDKGGGSLCGGRCGSLPTGGSPALKSDTVVATDRSARSCRSAKKKNEGRGLLDGHPSTGQAGRRRLLPSAATVEATSEGVRTSTLARRRAALGDYGSARAAGGGVGRRNPAKFFQTS